jgi:hypothetical protein
MDMIKVKLLPRTRKGRYDSWRESFLRGVRIIEGGEAGDDECYVRSLCAAKGTL